MKKIYKIFWTKIKKYKNNNNILNNIDYNPGNLIIKENGMILSKGLVSRIIAKSGDFLYDKNGSIITTNKFHFRPDGAACFENGNGWIYVSNSEMFTKSRDKGGVGAIYFDSFGNITNYKMILENSYANCGGGKTPWNTWLSCEEDFYQKKGCIWECDPYGNFNSFKTNLGEGCFESITCDFRFDIPIFYYSEDLEYGCIHRFTPINFDIDNSKDTLKKDGIIDYLIIDKKKKKFNWTKNKKLANYSQKKFYKNVEGIDCINGYLFFTCKVTKLLFVLDIDNNTFNYTKIKGLKYQPDQIKIRDEIIYFCEDGQDSGIYGLDINNNKYFTLLKSNLFKSETTGLAFSPNNKFMYFSFQEVLSDNQNFDKGIHGPGFIVQITRLDNKEFSGKNLDIKYHKS